MHNYGKTHCTRDDLCRKGLIVNRPPNWPHLSTNEQPLSSDEMDRHGYHAAAHARRDTENAWYGLDNYR